MEPEGWISYLQEPSTGPCPEPYQSNPLHPILFNHGMARPQFADGGDVLQLWRAATNILNKQSRTAEMGSSSSFGGWAWG
jgi:hypothetical protein